jgi:hypothetical protein
LQGPILFVRGSIQDGEHRVQADGVGVEAITMTGAEAGQRVSRCGAGRKFFNDV